MELGEPDALWKKTSVAVEGAIEELKCETVIMAIGQSPNPLIKILLLILIQRYWVVLLQMKRLLQHQSLVYLRVEICSGAAQLFLQWVQENKPQKQLMNILI